jgi:hypothetical protein
MPISVIRHHNEKRTSIRGIEFRQVIWFPQRVSEYVSKMSSLHQKRAPPRYQKRPYRHSWTDRELNLLSHFRQIHHWSSQQIRKSFFPSLSFDAVRKAYSRLSAEERKNRASIVSKRHRASNTNLTCSALGPCHLYIPIPVSRPIILSKDTTESSTHPHPVPQPKDNVGAHRSSTLRREDDRLLAPVDRINRYNLRPKRCQSFLENLSRHPVDRLRFPHFFKSYRKHLDLDGAPDTDYLPPSQSPSPDPSDRSPSVVPSLPSAASSLELFGLEARSLSPSDHDSSVTSSLPDDRPSPEFFSSEERPPTP